MSYSKNIINKTYKRGVKKGFMKKTNVLIKIGEKTTNFIVTQDNRVIFWGEVCAGGWQIINDVSMCLRLKFTDAEQITKAKGVCLSKAIGIKEDQILAEIIEARIKQIFNHIKEQLNSKGLLQNISSFFITEDDNYIPNMDKLLSRVMSSTVKVVKLDSIGIRIPSIKSRIEEIFNSYL